MKKKMYSLLSGILLSCGSWAQQPVKFETIKIAEAMVLPPSSPAEAYQKTRGQEKINSGTTFSAMENRFNQIFTGLSQRSAQQITAGEKSEKTVKKAHEDGINDMSPEQMAAYLKQHPELQAQTGVDPSSLELAAKMQDPAFQAKLEAMSDEEKVAFLSPYVTKSGSAAAGKYPPENTKTLAKASQLVHRFNEDYRTKNIEQVERQTLALEEKTDLRFNQEIDVLQQKLNVLPSGKGVSASVSSQRAALYEQIKQKKEAAWEVKLKGYREIISGSLSLFKVSAAPFDQWMAEINYGDQFRKSLQTDLLTQLAGYQEGYFRILQRLHEISKDVSLRAAAFYESDILPAKSSR